MTTTWPRVLLIWRCVEYTCLRAAGTGTGKETAWSWGKFEAVHVGRRGCVFRCFRTTNHRLFRLTHVQTPEYDWLWVASSDSTNLYGLRDWCFTKGRMNECRVVVIQKRGCGKRKRGRGRGRGQGREDVGMLMVFAVLCRLFFLETRAHQRPTAQRSLGVSRRLR